MRQIYNFEGARPPICNENLLRLRQARRKKQLQTVLCSIAAGIVMLCMLAFAALIAPSAPTAALVCAGYALISGIVCGAGAIVYAQKGGTAP